MKQSLLVLLVGYPMMAFATPQFDNEAVLPSQESVAVVKKPNSIFEDSSEYHRMKKNYQLSGQLIGYAVSPIPATGINAGMFMDRNTLLQLEWTKGESSWLSITEIEAETFGAHFKRFNSNSFYYNAGADYRRIIMRADPDAFIFGSNFTKKIGEVESLVASFSIGNQWQWQNFTLGCDWIGVMVPIIKLSSNYNADGLDSDDQKSAKNDWDEASMSSSIQLLRFYLGASF